MIRITEVCTGLTHHVRHDRIDRVCDVEKGVNIYAAPPENSVVFLSDGTRIKARESVESILKMIEEKEIKA